MTGHHPIYGTLMSDHRAKEQQLKNQVAQRRLREAEASNRSMEEIDRENTEELLKLFNYDLMRGESG